MSNVKWKLYTVMHKLMNYVVNILTNYNLLSLNAQGFKIYFSGLLLLEAVSAIGYSSIIMPRRGWGITIYLSSYSKKQIKRKLQALQESFSLVAVIRKIKYVLRFSHQKNVTSLQPFLSFSLV
jgi:hypothetical protein